MRKTKRLVILFISLIMYIIDEIVNVIHLVLKRKIQKRIVVLTYHSVKAEEVRTFERQMDMLLKLGYPISVELLGIEREGTHLIAVTFDDGFECIMKNALPIMRQRQIPATLFVPTGSIGNRPQWLCNSSHRDADETVLTTEQIAHLPDDLVSIGSHCINHPRLIELTDQAAMEELSGSRKDLEAITNTRITLLSFPYGSWDENILDLSMKAGYERVFGNIPSLKTFHGRSDVIGRIGVTMNDWMIEHYLKCMGAYRWLPIGVSVKKRIKLLAGKYFKNTEPSQVGRKYS